MKIWMYVLNMVLIAGLAFTAGFTAKDVNSLQQPEQAVALITGNSVNERASPADIIKEEQIKVYKDRIVINVEGAIWAKFANSGSMDPVLDQGANGLELPITDASVLTVGDIVSYETEKADGSIIHRIVYIGFDNEGRYFVMKGDNLLGNDPEKVRDSQLKYRLFGIIY